MPIARLLSFCSHTSRRLICNESTLPRSTRLKLGTRGGRRTTIMAENLDPSFDVRLQAVWDRGIQTGEVVYEDASSKLYMEDSIPFEARYLPCLDKKPTSRSPSPDPSNDGIGEQVAAIENDAGPRKESTSQADPFAAPRDNVVLELQDYTCVLNKYALEPGHFLVVTNEFYPQKGLLRASDLEMIYNTLGAPSKRHYCFFNGGLLAGASQEHRHFQFLPVPQLKAPCWPDQLLENALEGTKQIAGSAQDEKVFSHSEIPAVHFLLPIHDGSKTALEAQFKRLHSAAQKTIKTSDAEMPYNFLMTREYMMLMPRRNEEWDEHEIGVGGTCLIGSIMVTKSRDLETVRQVGLCRMLAYVGFPRDEQT